MMMRCKRCGESAESAGTACGGRPGVSFVSYSHVFEEVKRTAEELADDLEEDWHMCADDRCHTDRLEAAQLLREMGALSG